MGKKGSTPRQRVTDYRLSITYGICQGVADRLWRILLNEDKVAWEGSLAKQGLINISKLSLFGGVTKEGGVQGRVFYQRGTWDQLLDSEVSTRHFGKPPEESPGYRGIVTASFLGTVSRRGFLWGTNNPYIPPAWFTVTRIDRTWRPDIAAIGLLGGGGSEDLNTIVEAIYPGGTPPLGALGTQVNWDHSLFLEWRINGGTITIFDIDTDTRTLTFARQGTLGTEFGDAGPLLTPHLMRNVRLSQDAQSIYVSANYGPFGFNNNWLFRLDASDFSEQVVVDWNDVVSNEVYPDFVAQGYVGSIFTYYADSMYPITSSGGTRYLVITAWLISGRESLLLFTGDTLEYLGSRYHLGLRRIVAHVNTDTTLYTIVAGDSDFETTGEVHVVKTTAAAPAGNFQTVGVITPADINPALAGRGFHVWPVDFLAYDAAIPGLIMMISVQAEGAEDWDTPEFNFFIRWEEGVGVVWVEEAPSSFDGEADRIEWALAAQHRLTGDTFVAFDMNGLGHIYSTVTGALEDTFEINGLESGRSFDQYRAFAFNASLGLIVAVTDNGFSNATRPALIGLGLDIGEPADMNPAHIIRECLTNRVWGMGAPVSALDDASFQYAAEMLYAENFGLSMIWTQQDTIENFVREVLDHIEATLYIDQPTGRFVLKLIRNDYDPDTLPIFDETNCVVESFQTRSPAEIINEVVVTWTNPENEQEETYSLQDLGGIVVLGGEIISDNRNYYGVRNARLAAELAARDLSIASAPLATAEITTNRKGWRYNPGEVIKLSSAEHEAFEVIMRIVKIDFGSPKAPEIKVSLTQDIWSFERPVALPSPSTGHVDDAALPEPAEYAVVVTMPYFLVGATVDPVQLSVGEYPDVYMAVLASTGQADAQDFELWGSVVDAVGNTSTQLLGARSFVARGLLAEDWPQQALTATQGFTSLSGGTGPVVGGFALIGPEGAAESATELVAFQSSNWAVLRGLLDTVPRAWPLGTPIRFFSVADNVDDDVVRSAAETVSYRVLTRTSLGVLDYAAAPSLSHLATERPWLPTRPAGVTTNGVAWAEVDVKGLTTIPVEWANRNRVTEDSQVLAWDAATVTPEAGQTTRIRVRDFYTGVEVASISVAEGETSHDLVPDDLTARSIVRVTAERDGFESLQGYEQTLLAEHGYGYHYGYHYGGFLG